jgi:hypothetical protein
MSLNLNCLNHTFTANNYRPSGVTPSSETVCILTGCRWLKITVHFVGSPANSASVGEAETGSGGDQPVKE